MITDIVLFTLYSQNDNKRDYIQYGFEIMHCFMVTERENYHGNMTYLDTFNICTYCDYSCIGNEHHYLFVCIAFKTEL